MDLPAIGTEGRRDGESDNARMGIPTSVTFSFCVFLLLIVMRILCDVICMRRVREVTLPTREELK